MKLLKVSVSALLSVLAQTDEQRDLMQLAENSCCFDFESIECQDTLDQLYDQDLSPPRCPLFDKSAGGSCPNFCTVKPDDFSCSPYFIRGTRNSHFIPFGAENGDNVLKSKSLSTNSGPIDFDISFLGVGYKYAYVTGHGIIQLKKTKKATYDYYNYYKTMAKESIHYNSHATIAPYYGDFHLAKGGQVSWRVVDAVEAKGMKKYGYKKEKNCKIEKALIATWDKVLFTTYATSDNNGYFNSFQAVIATCSNGAVRVSFNYGDIEQDNFQYTGATKCGEEGRHYPSIGFAGKDFFWNHPFSNTDKADLVDDTSNVGINGRWNIKFNPNGNLIGNLENNVTLEPIQQISVPKITITAGAKGTSEFFTSAAFEQSLGEHGCHCAGMMGGENYGGPNVVDDVDALCKQWRAAKNCLHKQYGACENDIGSTYEISESFDECDDEEGCGGASCVTDVHFMQQINELVMADDWIAQPGTQDLCLPGQPDIVADSCCGDAPFVKSYDSNSAVCTDGQLE